MKILSAVYWRAGLDNGVNKNSLMLKIAEAKRGDNFLLAIICMGADSQGGEIVSGYMIEEMTKWFDSIHLFIMLKNKSVKWIKKKLLIVLRKINSDLAEHYKEKEFDLNSAYVIVAVRRKKYVIMHVGEVKAGKINKFTGYKQIDLSSQSNQMPKIKYGRVKHGEGFIFCNKDFLVHLSERQKYETLKPSEFRKENQIMKRLANIVDYSKQKGIKGDMIAIYMKFC